MVIFYSAFKTILNLKRKCPKCKREQVTKPSQRGKTVTCKFCKAHIPPRKNEMLEFINKDVNTTKA